MAVNPIQLNIDNTKSHRPYREVQGRIDTKNNTKPLPPQGHLIHDRLISMPKFFIKDFIYDMKAVKDGFKGTANDHQTGRLNDVGLKLGGIGIATMLAARTSNPMGRLMEYVGLGAFLASMSLFPKIAIQAPARARFGFDPGLEYIDDQGRKKSVFQDSNYIPFDMYKGDYPSEDLDIIGDWLGVPRGIKNRHDIIREQMRKIATQNNTLWIIMAGFATPVMTALICCGLEKLLAPAMEKARNLNYNSKITHALKRTEAMTTAVNEIKPNKLSKEVEKLLSNYKNQELPKNEFDNLVNLLTKNMDANASEGIKADLKAMFMPESKAETNKQASEEIINSIKNKLSNNSNKNTLEKIFVPTKEEMEKILNKNDIVSIKDELKKFFDAKIALEGGNKEFYEAYRNRILEQVSNSLKNKKVLLVDDKKLTETVDFAKIIGEFKENDKILDKCKIFKLEYTNETVLARSYAKFESTLLDVLGIKYKELKQMKESENFTKEILDKKLTELVKDENKYNKAVTKLAKVMAEMEVNLNGKAENGAHLKDLITAIENNYNNTAKRLSVSGRFKNTIDRLVKQDVKELTNSVKSREDLYNLLDGTLKPTENKDGIKYVIENAKGVGSSKNQVISRIVERYQGANNSFRRILHLFDFYKYANEKKNDAEIIKRGKDALLSATSSEHTLKLDTINNPHLYKDIMNTTWANRLEKTTKEVLEAKNNAANGNILDRFNKYIKRFRDIIGGNNIDFTKPEHITNGNIVNEYTKSSQTRMAKFNLVAQNSVDTVKNAASRRYGNQKWLRIASIIGGTVIGATLLAQLGFGHIRNRHNIQKQVSDDTNK